LSKDEVEQVYYAGLFMIYMQALRFLTDYINDDVYYGAKYPLHNYNRASNQIKLLEDYLQKKELLQVDINK
jgi:regulatory protein YycI of two-component signal transduction system YycFG